MEKLQANNIIGKTIPTTSQTIDGSSVLAVNQAQVQRFVDRVINPPAPVKSSATPRPDTTSPKAGTTPSASPTAIDSKCIN
jgi:hypothetical protein